MNKTTNRPRTNVAALLALLLAVTTVVANFGAAYAATLSTSSLSLSDARTGATSQYTVTANGFTTAQTIGCIEVDLGSSSDGTGIPAGLNASASTLVSQSITGVGGTWAVSNALTASPDFKLRAANATPVVPQSGSQTIVFGAITNGSAPSTSYFAVVKTYTTNSCATPVDTVTVQFVYTDAQSVTASVDPTLSFAVAGVTGNGVLAVNGATITNTLATSSTAIPFGTLSSGANKIAAQDVTVTTNAGVGYTVFTRYTGVLTSGSFTISDLGTAPNSTPVSFTGNGVEGFGYTTNDASLTATGAGANRFTTSGGNKWAAFTTSNAEVAYSATGVTSETTRVGFQTGIAASTEPGNYTTTVIYTATPIY